jgi:hypothetical protein
VKSIWDCLGDAAESITDIASLQEEITTNSQDQEEKESEKNLEYASTS